MYPVVAWIDSKGQECEAGQIAGSMLVLTTGGVKARMASICLARLAIVVMPACSWMAQLSGYCRWVAGGKH